MNRRTFVKKAAITTLGARLTNFSYFLPAHAASSAEKTTVGVVGCGNAGRAIIQDLLRRKDVEIAAVCDVYDAHRAQALMMAGRRATGYKDYRSLIERKDIDAVFIATPDHWHALHTIHACESGKDVFIETPLSLSVVEGRKMVDSAVSNKRIVQMSMPHRTSLGHRRAIESIRRGEVGEVEFVSISNSYNVPLSDTVSVHGKDFSAGLDDDGWIGPAISAPGATTHCFRGFRRYWAFSGGALAESGADLLDIVHEAMKVVAPLSVSGVGDSVMVDHRTPNNVEVIYEYPAFNASYSQRTEFTSRNGAARDYEIQFHGSKGVLALNNRGLKTDGAGTLKGPSLSSGEQSARSLPSRTGQLSSFIEAVKSRDLLASNIEPAHRSTSACLLGNISLRVNQKIRWDGVAERIPGNSDACQLLDAKYREPWRLA